MINSSGGQFFSKISYFRTLRKFVLFHAFFMNITNLASTYKTYRKKSSKSSQLCAKWIFIEYRAMVLGISFFKDILNCRYYKNEIFPPLIYLYGYSYAKNSFY